VCIFFPFFIVSSYNSLQLPGLYAVACSFCFGTSSPLVIIVSLCLDPKAVIFSLLLAFSPPFFLLVANGANFLFRLFFFFFPLFLTPLLVHLVLLGQVLCVPRNLVVVPDLQRSPFSFPKLLVVQENPLFWIPQYSDFPSPPPSQLPCFCLCVSSYLIISPWNPLSAGCSSFSFWFFLVSFFCLPFCCACFLSTTRCSSGRFVPFVNLWGSVYTGFIFSLRWAALFFFSRFSSGSFFVTRLSCVSSGFGDRVLFHPAF